MLRPTVILDADFDMGSLDVAHSGVDGDTVYLAGRDNFNIGRWKWVYFFAAGVRGRAWRFELPGNFETDPDRLGRHKMMFSIDDKTWRFFDHHDYRADEQRFRFWNDRPFERDRVWVAYGLPYPLARVVEWMGRVRRSPFVRPTPSGDGRLIIGRSSGGTDDCGRDIPPHDLYAFRIASDESVDTKRSKRIVLMAGVHPNEGLANFVLEGLVDYLLGATSEAERLRRATIVDVYPMANPDGRFAGLNRSTVQHLDRDANRHWRPDLWGDMQEIRTVGEALLQDQQQPPDYFIDFHSWTDTIGHFGILSHEEGFDRDPFWLALRELEPKLDQIDSGWKNPSTETFAFKQLGTRFSMTLETMYVPDENVDRYLNLGANAGRALAKAIL